MKHISRVTKKARADAHLHTGRVGELIARDFLEMRGHRTLEQNWNQPGVGEIDLITMSHGIIHIVEVKCVARESSDTCYTCNPAERVTDVKKSKIRRCAEVYLSKYQKLSRVTFTIVSVVLDKSQKVAYCEVIEDEPLF